MVQRLIPLMSNLVCPNQTSFLPGRQIADNKVVVQETLNMFKRSKSKKGIVMWKIDLDKAYDRIN